MNSEFCIVVVVFNRMKFANVAIVRFDAPLFFANVKHFEEMIAQFARREPRYYFLFCFIFFEINNELIKRQYTRPFAIVIDCSAITSCDSTAAVEVQKMLTEYGAPSNAAIDVPHVVSQRQDAPSSSSSPAAQSSPNSVIFRAEIREKRENS